MRDGTASAITRSNTVLLKPSAYGSHHRHHARETPIGISVRRVLSSEATHGLG